MGGRIEEAALLGDRDNGERAGKRLRAQRRAFEGIGGDIDGRAAAPEVLADVKERRFVLLAFADHDPAGDRQIGDLAVHGLDRGGIGLPLVAAPAKPGCRHGGALRHARNIQGKRSRQAA